MEGERSGFDEMDALALASLFWRCSRQTLSDMDKRQRFGSGVNIKFTPCSRRQKPGAAVSCSHGLHPQSRNPSRRPHRQLRLQPQPQPQGVRHGQ
jgi:hypothetical protein